MGRVVDAILQDQAFSRGHQSAMLDPQYGGQMGYSPDLGEWVSHQAYVRRNVIALLLEAPLFFQLMPDPGKMISTLRAVIERHPTTIEGLNRTLTVSTDQTPVGGGGEEQEEVTDVKRTRTEPVFTYHDKYGMPISTFFDTWIRYGLMDPDTKFALAGTLANYPSDMLADMYSATVIFIEPDPTHRKVVKSWLCTNMFPKSSGDIVGSRDINNALQMSQLSIPFSSIAQSGLGVDAFAQTLLNSLSITNANPLMAASFKNGIDNNVADAYGGYAQGVETLATTSIKVA
jgi:hypothetical protein